MNANQLELLRDASKDDATFEKLKALFTQMEAENLRLSQTLQAYESITTSISNGFALVDRNYQYLSVNSAYSQRVNTTPEQLTGQHVSVVVGQDAFENTVKQNLDACFQGQVISFEDWFHFQTGRRYIAVVYTPHIEPDGTITGAIVSTQDITDMKLAQEQVAYHAKLLDTVTDAIITTDSNFDIVHWNKASEQIYGWQAHEVLGKQFGDVIHSDYPGGTIDEALDILMETGSFAGDFIQSRKDGTTIPIQTRVTVIRDNQGKMMGTIAVNRDISQQVEAAEQLHQTEQFLRAVYEGVQSSLFVVDVTEDNDFILSGINPTHARSLGLKPEEVIGKRPEEIPGIDPTVAATVRANYERCVERQITISYEEVVRFDGVNSYWYTQLSPLIDENNRVYRIIGLAQNLTREKEALQTQELLATTQVELEREREQRTFQNKIISMITHDFKTPLSVILTDSDKLLKYHDRLTDEQRETTLNRIKQQSYHIGEMVDELVMLKRSTVYQYKPYPETVNISEFVHGLVADVRLAQNNPVDIHVSISGDIYQDGYDVSLLRQIFTNLIANAIKYSKKDGNVFIYCDCDVDSMTFYVRDQGVGIPAEAQSHIFDLFYRANNVGKVKGTGIGLAIVKQAVDLHNGSISLTSEVNLGTQITVQLPSLVTSPTTAN